MTHNIEQNGRQQPQLCNNDSRQQQHQWMKKKTLTTSDKLSRICRNFVWGICTKGSQCKFRHELDVESMKSIVVFCNDFQNRIGCNRPHCSYIHGTREEKELFLSAGQIPRALLERHATISTVKSAVPESAPMGFVPEQFSKLQAPPPPPPPEVVHTVAPAPPLTAAMPVALARPPPPPPPPTVAPTAPRLTGLIYSVPPPQSSSTQVGGYLVQPPMMVPAKFYSSKPPPPLHQNSHAQSALKRTANDTSEVPPPQSSSTQVGGYLVQTPMMVPVKFDASKPPPPLHQNSHAQSALKRTANDTSEAGPSKMKKTEGPRDVDNLCDNCVQREIRIEMYRQEMQKLHCEEEFQNIQYKKKLEEYETGCEMLKSAIGPQLFQVIDHYFESSSQDGLGNYLNSQALQASAILNNNSELHALLAATQKSNDTNNTSSGVIQEFLEVLRNRNLSHHTKYGNIAGRNYPSGVPTASTSVPAPASTYMPCQPVVPPPPNGAYQAFNTNCNNVPQSVHALPQARMAAPPAAALPSTTACAPAPPPLHAHNGVTYSQHYSAWRYASQPPSYPPQ